MSYNFQHILTKSAKLFPVLIIGVLAVIVISFSGTILKYLPAALIYSGGGGAAGSSKYAYSENLGWFNSGAIPYQGSFNVAESQLTGYIWTENVGWISLNCLNDNSCSSVDYGIANDGRGSLSGYAWAENVGWVNFNPTGGGVDISNSGIFSGYAWGENVGWISFNCSNDNSCSSVDYKLAVNWSFVEAGGGGGLPSQAYMPPSQPAQGGFGVLINSGSIATNEKKVVLSFTVGPDVARMSISNDPNFTNAVQEPFVLTKLWAFAGGYGQKTVYVKFFTSYGVASETVSAKIDYSLTGSEQKGIAEEIKNVADKIASVGKQIARLFGNQESSVSYPPISESVPKETPTALQGLEIMSVNPLGKLELSPIKSDLAFFADKLPQLKTALDALSINPSKPEDIKKISQTDLFLPGLTQTLLARTEVLQANMFVSGQVLSLAQLSPEIASEIPNNIVFARILEGLIDLEPALNIDSQGDVEQRISTVSGKSLELVIKPDGSADKVSGLISLKKRQSSKADQLKQNIFARLFGAALSVANNTPAAQNSASETMLVQKFEYFEVVPSVFKAEINAPALEGEYRVATIIEYKDEALPPAQTSLTLVVDPEGYVYRQTADGRLRIENAIVSLYWLNHDTKEYELWPSGRFLQRNPVLTDNTGKYSFLAPQGTYYLTVQSPGYLDYKGDSFVIKEDNRVRMDIGLKKKTFLPDWLSWELMVTGILLLIIIILVCIFIVLVRARNRNDF